MNSYTKLSSPLDQFEWLRDSNLLSLDVPIKTYSNLDVEKGQIYSENKSKCWIFLFGFAQQYDQRKTKYR